MMRLTSLLALAVTAGCAHQAAEPEPQLVPVQAPVANASAAPSTSASEAPLPPPLETREAKAHILPGGLQVRDTYFGSGPEAARGNTVTVHYVGHLLDGTVFDSSRDRNEPFKFTLGQNHVIRGWEEGIPGMMAGGMRTLVIPPELAYGTRGAPPKIGPNTVLVFDVELLKIE